MKKQTITDKKEKNMETEVITTPAENLSNLVQVNENDISAASEGNQDNSVITAPISTQEAQNDNGQPSSSTNDSVDTSENNEAIGIGQEYDAAWEYLEAVYGDTRFVADIITQDISKFKPMKEGEDT
ncbi:hypothetical protein DSY43_00310 [Paramuricea clavata]|uniref:Uncharacterized protein n=1 Tax=Paramuricea clavata TaxID=317549 RepID=A0A7D9EQ59_PARCT|nr:hypothetical protein DSY43_00310 [Paramuricea clavata]